MLSKIKPHQKISMRIMFAMVALFTVTTVVASVMNRRNLTRVYESNFNEYVLLTNRLIATIVDYEDTRYFAELLASQPEEFKELQVRYYYDRNRLYELESQNAAGGAERAEILSRMAEFRAITDALKNDRYWEIVDGLKGLKQLSRARYIYVFADTGLVTNEGEKLYPYIFIANDVPVMDAISYDDDWLGTVYTGEPAVAEIFASGKPMDSIIHYDDMYGELCYAYAPILNENGETVAILGTDLALDDMLAEIKSSVGHFDMVLLGLMLFILVTVFIIVTRAVTSPLRDLTKTALVFAEGDTGASVPESALKQRSELGALARALGEMNSVCIKMLKTADSLFNAALNGTLDARGNESAYKGDFGRVIGKINDVLDIMVMYLNNIPIAMFITDADFKMNFCNERFTDAFGACSPEEFFALAFSADAEASMLSKGEKLERLLAQSAPQTVWFNDACFSVAAKKIGGEKRGEGGVIMTLAIDITDLTREKNNAQAAAKSKSDFLSRMSHEIRTPMNAIIGMTKIAHKTEDIIRLRYCLSTIESSSKLLLGIINDVLDMSKIEAGKLELENAPINLEKILSVIHDVIIGDLEKKRLRFSIILNPGTDLNYIGDETRLSQVITNILSNAMKFTQDNGKITLHVKEVLREGSVSTLRFTISDTGIGMTREQLGRLFNSFEQADGTITRRFGGTGLGLAISKSIVEKMNGRIWAESEYGVGSTFIFEVNLEKLADAYKAEPFTLTYQTPDFSRLTILLAEDIEINREIFTALLAETRITIDTAENGLEAVMKFKENPEKYDLIVMDIQMPEMDGLEATRKIRATGEARAKFIPIIALSANVFTDDIAECTAAGMNDHLPKPINFEQLTEKIARYARKGRAL